MKKRWLTVFFAVIVTLAMVLVGCPNGDDNGGGGDGDGTDWSVPVDGRINVDILVIGAGGAGLSASNTVIRGASDEPVEGRKVLLIEQNPHTRWSATAFSGGGFASGGNSWLQTESGETRDSVQWWFDDLINGGEHNDHRMASIFARNNGHATSWLVQALEYPILRPQFNMDSPTAAEYRAHRTFSMPQAIMLTETLIEPFEDAGGVLKFDVYAEELLTDDSGRVIGAKVKWSDDSTVEIFAEMGVILTTGGYSNNPVILAEYASALVPVLYYGHEAVSQGKGLLMAMEHDAIFWHRHRGKVYANAVQYRDNQAHATTGAAMQQTLDTNAIYVNKQGSRVVNENDSFIAIKHATVAAPDSILFFFMDEVAFTAWRPRVAARLPEADLNAYITATVGTPFTGFPIIARADTIAGVAAIAGVDPVGLQNTVDRFNGFISNATLTDYDKDEDFGREIRELADRVTATFRPMRPISATGPYYLVEQKLRFATTLGGLKVDDQMRVLAADNPLANEVGAPVYGQSPVYNHTNERIIPGLYAGGEVIGGIHGEESLPGTNVGWALTSGRLAGLSITGRTSQIEAGTPPMTHIPWD